jgi:NADH dehydrogenase [ubiquinone] 1 alpha subcomplex assembly factor 7
VSSPLPEPPASPDVGAELTALIEAHGSVSIERFMAAANTHYYATRDAIGATGDFITAPEVSQMFGEIVGLALADVWQRGGRPADAALVELGPGRGTLMADMLRAVRVAHWNPEVHFVETSPLLRAKQAEQLPDARWHDTIRTLHHDRPLLIVANEFFDALPIRQVINTFSGWRERVVRIGIDGFEPAPGAPVKSGDVPAHLRHSDPGGVIESCPAARALMRGLARRLHDQGGVLLVIDYGHVGGAHGDTLQAVHAHAYADPFARPGTSDLTAHVDFAALAGTARAAGTHVAGPAEQGQWLVSLGLSDRAAALGRAAPQRAHEIADAYRRLTHADEMGALFKVMAVTGRGWPTPGGF